MKNILKEQDDLQRQEIAKILSWAYKILPICYGLIIVIRIFTGGWVTVYSMTAAALSIPLANHYLKKGKIEASLVILTLSLIITITVAVTYANGIHDIGIMAYPIILLISSLMLRSWQQVIFFIMVVIALIWLAMSENLGYYAPSSDLVPNIAELIIILVIILMSAMICYRIAGNLKNALRSRDREIHLTAIKLSLLQKSLDQKIQLTNAIHSQVVDSISIIRELLSKQDDQPLKKLPSQLLVIELIHAELFRLELEKELDLENYLDMLFERQNENFKLLLKEKIDDIMINVDQSLSIGMLLTELANENNLEGFLSVTQLGNYVSIRIHSPQVPFKLTMLSEIMIRQLNGKLDQSNGLFQISFDQKPVA